MRKYLIIWYNITEKQDDHFFVLAENKENAEKIVDFIIRAKTNDKYNKRLMREMIEIKNENCIDFVEAQKAYEDMISQPKPEHMFKEVETNSHGVNIAIKANILKDARMREIGFTDYGKTNWYFCRGINFPKSPQYRGFDVSFSVSIPKDGSEIRIDVLDEAFCQPYDYQRYLNDNPNHKTGLIILEQVEKYMEYLQNAGVLEGHVRGEYI